VFTHSKRNFQLILQYQASIAVNAGGQVTKFNMADFMRDDTMETLVLQNKYYTYIHERIYSSTDAMEIFVLQIKYNSYIHK